MSIINTSNKKFAVIIGINYVGSESQLNGCINDANHIKNFLITKCGYLQENILMLADDNINQKPTKQNIINSFATLVSKSTNEQFNELWFSYSGHGSYVRDTNGDEKDGNDEVLCPVDYATNGMIVDDFIYANLVAKLPQSATLFSIIDSCHSGTMFDLPFLYTQDNKIISNNGNKSHVATVVSISGCRDDQTSADAYINSNYEGAMTWSFLNALANAKYNIKMTDLVNNMRILLKSDYTQVPLLAITNTADVDRLLIGSITIPTTPDPSTTKPIKFKITTDYWFGESSWNVFSVTDNAYLWANFNKFTSRNQTTELTKQLKLGSYKLVINDTYGDGGVTSLVTDGVLTLVSAKMRSGRSAEYGFDVKI